MGKWIIKNGSSQKGKVLIITDANSGIGFETAVEIAKNDTTVTLSSLS